MPFDNTEDSSDDDDDASSACGSRSSDESSSLIGSGSAFQSSNLPLDKNARNPPNGAGRQGLYADDDSEVSSDVTPLPPQPPPQPQPQPQPHPTGPGQLALIPHEGWQVMASRPTSGAAALTLGEVTEDKGSIMPSGKREWCIVCFAIVMILSISIGIGLGLGLGLGGGGSNPNITDGSGDKPSGGSPGMLDLENPTDPTSFPSLAPTSVPTESPITQMNKDYAVISQKCQEIVAFGGPGEDGLDEAQEKTRDFLILGDFVPEDGANNDDVVALPQNGGGGGIISNLGESYLTTSTPAYRVVQRFAVATLYFATGGDRWTSNEKWVQPAVHECEWIGVTCIQILVPAVSLEDALRSPNEIPLDEFGNIATMVERMITEIHLPENGMAGTLPKEVTTLPYLERLHLWSNKLRGDVPTNIADLSRLRSLYLDANEFVGTIPTEIGLCTDLEDLALYNNPIRGEIPTEIGLLTNLKRLWLSYMNIRGTIPAEVGQLENLNYLYLEGNRLRGEIPPEISRLKNISELRIEKNVLDGTVPCQSYDPAAVLSADCKGNGPVTCTCCTKCY